MQNIWEWLITSGAWVRSIWILAALIIGLVLFLALRHWADRLVKGILPEQVYTRLEKNRKTVDKIIIAVGSLFILLAMAAIIAANLGVDISPLLVAAGAWLLEHGIRIAIIIAVGYLVHVFAKALLPWLVERSIVVNERQVREEMTKRVQTLSQLFTQTIDIVILITIFFMVLSEMGIDIAPLLAGAGIAGIAIGFGAQNLIKDIINGIFILAENQYNVGDVVKIANIPGLVESITLRRTVLRDLDGIVHSIPNGEITTSSNFTKEVSRVNLNIPVAYGTDIDQCIAVINKVGAELAKDKCFGPMVLSPLAFLRVDNFGESGIELKVLGETRPLKQWDVAGEFRLRIKKAFDKEGIEIPWPHMKLYFGDESFRKWLERNPAK